MSILIGRNAKVVVGSATIAELSEWSLNQEAPLLTAEVFGTTHTKVGGVGLISAAGSVSGFQASDDTTGQDIIEAAVQNSTSNATFKLYVDATNYYTSDTTTDSDATCYFSNWSITVVSQEINKISFDYQFSGPIHKTDGL